METLLCDVQSEMRQTRITTLESCTALARSVGVQLLQATNRSQQLMQQTLQHGLEQGLEEGTSAMLSTIAPVFPPDILAAPATMTGILAASVSAAEDTPVQTSTTGAEQPRGSELAAPVGGDVMSRTVDTVTQVWEEYEHGFNGRPSIRSLNQAQGQKWRVPNSLSKFYSRQRMVYCEVYRKSDELGIAPSQAAVMVEAERKEMGITLPAFRDYLKSLTSYKAQYDEIKKREKL
eukprot:Colp12_sorted_trinity150504_noHs@25782